MGVHGLWKLLEPSGKPINLESLENKVLAIDVSMWLHQVMKGYQDSTGNALPNAHLLGLFHRVCKLMFYRIRPVFVFDGGVPQLKQQTLASRRQMRGTATKKAERERLKLLRNIMEQGAVRQALAGSKRPSVSTVLKKPSAFSDFILEPMPAQEHVEDSSEEELDGSEEECEPAINWDTFDPESKSFKRLSAQERIEILTDLKEARKQNSWGRIHEMPQESGEFSGYQLRRLLVRRSAQVGLEEAEREMGERHSISMAQLHSLMEERGSLATALDEMGDSTGQRIASDNTTRFLLIKKQHPSPAKSSQTSEETEESSEPSTSVAKSPDEMSSVVKSPDRSGRSVETVDLEEEVDEDLEMVCIKSQIEEETELSQAEILALIKTSNAYEKPTCSRIIDQNMPSTSSTGVYEQTVFDSSDFESQNNFTETDYEYNSLVIEPDLSNSEFEKTITEKELEIKMLIDKIHNKKSTQTLPDKLIESIATIQVPAQNNKIQLNKSNKISEIETNDIKVSFQKSESKNLASKDVKSTIQSINTTSIKSIKINEEFKAEVNGISTLSSQYSSDIKSKSPPMNLVSVAINKSSKVEENGISSPNSVTVEENSSSDDGFEEVPGSPDNSDSLETGKLGGLEIMIDPEKAKKSLVPEEDIFADIFESVKVVPSEEHVAEITDSEDESVASEIEVPKVETVTAKTSTETKSDQVAENVAVATKSVPVPPKISNEELIVMEETLAKEQRGLANEVGRQERLAASISDQMCVEAQELLRLFGLPYVTAPMEAEAQCAVLDLLSLTQGTVTDDSDIWLFGGRTVYRNFFNQSRNVEAYTADTINKCFKLSRSQLVLLALLVGSDYTSGLQGVGPVTALEILAAFPGEAPPEQPDELVKPLRRFRDWWSQRQEAHSAKLKRLRSKLRDLAIHDGFPSEAVVEAYIHPEVDDSREKFSWGKPDVPALIQFGREKFGWTTQHAESILQPVIKRMENSSVQQRLDSFFSVIPQVSRVEDMLSTRVRQAISQLGSTSDEPSTDDPTVEPSVSKRAAPSSNVPPKKRKGVEKPPVSTLEAMRQALTKKPRRPKIPLLPPKPATSEAPKPSTNVVVEEHIPQREKDKDNALRSKMKAIELFRKRKLDPTPRNKKVKQSVKNDHYLSESSSDGGN